MATEDGLVDTDPSQEKGLRDDITTILAEKADICRVLPEDSDPRQETAVLIAGLVKRGEGLFADEYRRRAEIWQRVSGTLVVLQCYAGGAGHAMTSFEITPNAVTVVSEGARPIDAKLVGRLRRILGNTAWGSAITNSVANNNARKL
ncbi:MAG TPA: hypothetical protein VMR34_04500 [Candidatus Saccharimonadales bacterium]|nr:hypothetical protein [Candidatus Saccharimonadales bacterium]